MLMRLNEPYYAKMLVVWIVVNKGSLVVGINNTVNFSQSYKNVVGSNQYLQCLEGHYCCCSAYFTLTVPLVEGDSFSCAGK